MSESAKDAIGQAKERIARVTGDRRLELAGQTERAGEYANRGAHEDVDRAKQALRRR